MDLSKKVDSLSEVRDKKKGIMVICLNSIMVKKEFLIHVEAL